MYTITVKKLFVEQIYTYAEFPPPKSFSTRTAIAVAFLASPYVSPTTVPVKNYDTISINDYCRVSTGIVYIDHNCHDTVKIIDSPATCVPCP